FRISNICELYAAVITTLLTAIRTAMYWTK
ncbi:hypothetical protein, partial [Salmonella enterica]